MIVRRTIVDAYKMIGDLSDRESLDGTRSNIGLQLLNDLVSSLNLEDFFAYTIKNLVYSPTVSKREYTIGNYDATTNPDVDINADRPTRIKRVYLVYAQNNSTSSEVTLVAPQDIPLFSRNTTSSSLPTYASYVSNYPNGTVVFSSPIALTYNVIISYNTNIPVFEFNDDVAIPPEYEPALKYGLASLLADRYSKPDSIQMSMDNLRDEAYRRIRENTLAKTPLMYHLLEDSNFNQNIYNMGLV